MSTDSSYDNILLKRIANDDEKAFTELFHLYTPRLIPFLVKLTRNDHIAREMIQETFLRIWINRQQLDKVNNAGGWIYKIASNVSITYLKTQSNRERILQKIPVAEANEPVSELLDSKQLNLIIYNAVNQLPEKRQEIYRLSREEGLSHQEIAEKLGISPHTVKNQIGISLKFIQEHISRESGLSVVALLTLFSR